MDKDNMGSHRLSITSARLLPHSTASASIAHGRSSVECACLAVS